MGVITVKYMTHEEAVFCSLMARAGLSEVLLERYGDLPVRTDLFTRSLAALRFDPTDTDGVLAILQSYIDLAGDIDGKAVLDMVWQELHDRYAKGKIVRDRLVDAMYVIAYYYTEAYGITDPLWKSMLMMADCFDEAREGLIPAYIFEDALKEFMEHKAPDATEP